MTRKNDDDLYDEELDEDNFDNFVTTATFWTLIVLLAIAWAVIEVLWPK